MWLYTKWSCRYLLLLQTLPSYSFLFFSLHKTPKPEKPLYKTVAAIRRPRIAAQSSLTGWSGPIHSLSLHLLSLRLWMGSVQTFLPAPKCSLGTWIVLNKYWRVKKKTEKGRNIIWRIIAENFPKLGKETNMQIQEDQKDPDKMHSKWPN